MKSTSGEHYLALDHVRAIACALVFVWHFTHTQDGTPVPFEYVPSIFPFAILDEGHTGVALFMTLSGYLFAKLLTGKNIYYGRFLFNRALRLVPLLALVIVIVGVRRAIAGEPLAPYAASVLDGLILPSLPNGGWSITVEFHYYLVIPVFLWLLRRSRWLPLAIVFAALALRIVLYRQLGSVQWAAYGTIVGRVDQFALGMFVFQFRDRFAGRHLVAAVVLTAFAGYYWYYDLLGGFYRNPSFPSPSPLWIFHTTLEGAAYAIAVAWYDASFAPADRGFSRLLGTIGTYSYSIYLLHFFFVFDAALFVHRHVMALGNFYVACVWALGALLLMIPVGYLSFRFVEAPFLKLRRRYIYAPVAAAA